MDVLKERVCSVIDSELSAEIEERDYGEDESVDLMNRFVCLLCANISESLTRTFCLGEKPALKPSLPKKNKKETLEINFCCLLKY